MKIFERTYVKRTVIFEVGDYVKITNFKDLGKTTVKKFNASLTNKVIEADRFKIKLEGFDGYYHHKRFEIDLRKTRRSKILGVIGDDNKSNIFQKIKQKFTK